MRKNSAYYVIGASLMLAVFFYIWNNYIQRQHTSLHAKSRKEIYNYDPAKCPGDTVQIKSSDPYMRGLVDQGTQVTVVLNSTTCEALKKGDLVLYRYSEFEDPVIKRVVGEPGDHFEVVKANFGQPNWQLKINKDLVKSGDGSEYYFGAELPPPLSIAAEARKGLLGPEDAIIFSAFPPGNQDSGTFGVISIRDLVGKIQPKK